MPATKGQRLVLQMAGGLIRSVKLHQGRKVERQHFPIPEGMKARGEGGGGGMMESNVVSLEIAKKLRKMQTYYVFSDGRVYSTTTRMFLRTVYQRRQSQTNAIWW